MIHREGKVTIALTFLFVLLLAWLSCYLLGCPLCYFGWVLALGLFLFILSFFRNPKRTIEDKNEKLVYAPADGKVVVIEDVKNDEYPGNKGVQVSIFMSPANVHVNRIPCNGTISYAKYHPGKYLAAWHPKSSEENERFTTVVDSPNGPILLKQVAGALARRICNYMSEGQSVEQGQEMGFIKFGSRVDMILPKNSEILVQMDQKVLGNKTVIARFS